MSEKLLFQVVAKPGEYNIAVQSSSVPSIAGKKDLADYLRRCAERIELGEWPFGNNSPTVELGGEA